MDQLRGPAPSAGPDPSAGPAPSAQGRSPARGRRRATNPPGLLDDLRRRAPELRDAILRHPSTQTATARVAEWSAARPRRRATLRPGVGPGSDAPLAEVLVFRPASPGPDGPTGRSGAQIVDLAHYRARRRVDPRSAS